MKGIILVNAYSENAEYLYQANRLQAEFEKVGVNCEIVRNFCGIANTEKDGKINLSTEADFAVFLDKDKYTARFLEGKGVRLFNSASAVAVCDDKMLTHIALAGKGIPMPKSMPAPLCYTPDAEIPSSSIKRVISKLSLPVVVKHSYGSLGKGVFLVQTEEELLQYAKELRFTPHFYQEYISESRGRDLRVIAVGGEVIAGMVRSSRTDFRSNVSLGGNAAACVPDENAAALVKRISEILGLDYCGVDLLFGKDGFTVCEVNSNAYFCGMEKATGVNVAAAYVEYILKQMRVQRGSDGEQ